VKKAREMKSSGNYLVAVGDGVKYDSKKTRTFLLNLIPLSTSSWARSGKSAIEEKNKN
jgi:hypothetical protein